MSLAEVRMLWLKEQVKFWERVVKSSVHVPLYSNSGRNLLFKGISNLESVCECVSETSTCCSDAPVEENPLHNS